MLANHKITNLVLLAVLDGWGIAPPGPGNAITQANIPNFKRFISAYPNTQVQASGEAVGLPRGEVGNTETGHLNIGAGRIVYQDLVRINMSIADGAFFNNQVLVDAIEHARKNNSKLHLVGLVGAGGVHSNIEHLFALIQLAARLKFNNVFVHVFTDGRDSPPKAAASYIQKLEEVMQREGVGKIASVMGRYWAMDRDQRWDRTARAYFALTKGDGRYVTSAIEAIETSYAEEKTDEFVEPSLISIDGKTPIALIQENDSLIFFNFRIDRPRQLSRAFVMDDLSVSTDSGYDPYAVEYAKKHNPTVEPPPVIIHRGDKIKNLNFVMMTDYGKFLSDSGAKIAFPPEKIIMSLGQVLSVNNLKQLRASESEKERFVGYYFNGLSDKPFINEDRLVVLSPDVATYDLKPEMSAYELTDTVINKIKSNPNYQFVLVNYANADMVGHTGNITAAIKGIEAIDVCIGKLEAFVESMGGIMMITADHGNAEEMLNKETGEMDTEHSSYPVPFIAIGSQFVGKAQHLKSGILGDIAPTILSVLGIEKPFQMTGRNLLEDIMK